ncbi:MAG: lamin tail domain-containing protein [Candidatus Liptonbacteria bacterium]|nr:lamin tail domain-containing protein [Candidatus Liptonbacteria bacterium]
MRFILAALGAVIVAGVVSYATVTRFAGYPVPLKEAGKLVSATISDAVRGSPGEQGGKPFMEISRERSSEDDIPVVSPKKIASAAMRQPNAPAKSSQSKSAPSAVVSGPPVRMASAASSVVSSAATSSQTIPPLPLEIVPPEALPEETMEVCDFSERKHPTHLVLLNEIAWMGSTLRGAEDGGGGAQAEWLELKNNFGRDIDLADWRILNKAGKFKIDFDSGDELKEGAHFLLERGDDETVLEALADKTYSGALLNSGDWLRLFDARCRLVDEVDGSHGWPAGDNTSKKTMERSAVDLSWNTSGVIGGTPGVINSAMYTRNSPPILTASPVPSSPTPSSTPSPSSSPSTSSAASSTDSAATSTVAENASSSQESASGGTVQSGVTHVVIAAVQITGGTGLSGNDFVKLYNPTANPIVIGGWKLRKRAQTGSESSVRVFAGGRTISAGGYFTWANSADGFAVSVGANESSTQTIASNNSIAFLNADGALVDALAWGEGHVNPFAEAGAYPANPEGGQRLTRKIAGGAVQDTDNNAADFEIQ